MFGYTGFNGCNFKNDFKNNTLIVKNKMVIVDNPDQIVNGVRGTAFRIFLFNVLKLSGLKEQYIKVLLDKEIDVYEAVFTHPSANPNRNYEFYEFVGDVTLNKSIAWYLSRRFPQLCCTNGVKILTRLKINLVSKRAFEKFAKKLHFWNFVSATNEIRVLKMAKTLEDVFESFFGATEMLIDKHFKPGLGYKFCYNIIEQLLDTLDISLKYERLFDAKTRLKEMFDYFGKENLGELKYLSEKQDRIHQIQVVRVLDGKQITMGNGSAPLKADAQQRAAQVAIKKLQSQGFVKPLSENYVEFCS